MKREVERGKNAADGIGGSDVSEERKLQQMASVTDFGRRLGL